MRYCYIIVDGLGYDQIRRVDLPFLQDAGFGMDIKPLRTLLAYSSGIYPSMWSGRYPEEHGVWSEFFFDPHAGRGLTDGLRYLPAVMDSPRRAKYVALATLARAGIRPKDYFGLPPSIERYFRRAASDYRTLPPVRPPGIQMIDEVMDAAGHAWQFVYTANVVAAPPTAHQVAVWSQNESFFYSISDADEAGHRFGPGSAAYSRFLRHLDDRLRSFTEMVREQNPGVEFFLFSDHGMNPVRETIDLWTELKHTHLSLGRDYVAFLNSTLASFWFLTPDAESNIRAVLARVRGGRVLEAEDLTRYHLRFRDRRYGDLLFLADPGVEIVPNFMSLARRPSPGMHGYAPEDPETTAFIAGPRAKIATVGEVTDLFSLVQANVEGGDRPLREMADDTRRVAR